MKTDSEIQKNVMEELKYEPLLNSTEIGVAVKNGIVTLSGTVDLFNKKKAAERAAKRVLGVKAVAEDIVVRISALGKRTDTEIAEAVVNALKWHSSVPDDKIKIKVEEGWVTLEGDVEWQFQRNSAKYVIENLHGVVGISNNIVVTSKVTADDIKRKILAAYHRSATIDADKVNIEVTGNKVTLSGKVRSYAELKDAEAAAWLAPGINKVENRLEVDTAVFTY